MKAMRAIGTVIGVAVAFLVAGSPAEAHTDSDVVAVPAGSAATVTLQPTHGCGESPTVAVRIRAPFADAVAEPVDGWTVTATPDGAGNTVLEWSGGVLPADQTGAFPVGFTAPDTPGTLLTFPAIQICESGEELAWISGDPASEFPAPRILVLPAGAEPAATIDDVPPDAPGREQLVAIVDVDNPQGTPTTTAVPTTTAAPTTTAVPTTTAAPTITEAPATSVESSAPTGTEAPVSAAPAPTTTEPDDSDGSPVVPIVVGVIAALAVAAGAVILVRRRAP